VADFYVAGFDSADDPASAALLDLLGPVAGQRVLDAACGHGRISRELARRGAAVTGVDISAVLLDRARAAERDEPLGITYLHADIAASPAAASAGSGYDTVTCNFGLSDIDDLDGALAAVSAALRPGGRLVFSILHPCFPGADDIAGSWPGDGRYYDEGWWLPTCPRSALRRQVGGTHRTLATYLNTLRRHGLWLDEAAEPLPPSQWDREHRADRTPVFLAARCLRLAGGSGRLVTPPIG
jgi:2-polyprenyl-3-methyl-5-hydroxy-6-metoxy-1,4-benzoquinol methylase